MDLKYSADKIRYRTMLNEELRDAFVISNLFQPDEMPLTYSDIDRGVIGSAVPLSKDLSLPTHKELAADYFAERREIGVINIGGDGTIIVDGARYEMANRDSLYIAKGSREVIFSSKEKTTPAKFYFVSYPAHTAYQTTHVPQASAHRIELGTQAKANKRVIYQSIRPGIVETCQIVMGFTSLEEGNVWNTFPPHTHKRRSEYYMYFDLPEGERMLHLMGEEENVRSLILSNQEVALSPSWSMHSGCGTSAYTFIWSMGGENQEFDDMDHITPTNLK